MPDWVSKATCRKCKKKGHLAFNCPPKYENKPYKSKNDVKTGRSISLKQQQMSLNLLDQPPIMSLIKGFYPPINPHHLKL